MNDTKKARKYVLDHIDQKTALLMVMEQASELIQACSKVLRVQSDDPCAATPVQMIGAMSCVFEEFNDLLVAGDAAHILCGFDTGNNIKWLRWAQRAKEAEKHGNALESQRE